MHIIISQPNPAKDDLSLLDHSELSSIVIGHREVRFGHYWCEQSATHSDWCRFACSPICVHPTTAKAWLMNIN